MLVRNDSGRQRRMANEGGAVVVADDVNEAMEELAAR